jgi:hypothetical protein
VLASKVKENILKLAEFGRRRKKVLTPKVRRKNFGQQEIR